MESKIPEDDGEPRLHGYRVPGDETVHPLGCRGQFMNRKTALEMLEKWKSRKPRELHNVPSVELVDFEDLEYETPRSLAQISIQPTVGDLGRAVAAQIFGSSFTITMPTGSPKEDAK